MHRHGGLQGLRDDLGPNFRAYVVKETGQQPWMEPGWQPPHPSARHHRRSRPCRRHLCATFAAAAFVLAAAATARPAAALTAGATTALAFALAAFFPLLQSCRLHNDGGARQVIKSHGGLVAI